MKYLKSYKIFESNNKNDYYYTSVKVWDYQLGYLWSPKVNIGSGDRFHSRNDSSVNRVDIKHNNMSDTLANRTVFPLFKEHFGTNNLDELCEFNLRNLGYDYGPKDEFSFLDKGLIEKRCYVNIRIPGNPDIIKQVPDFKRNYLDIVGDIIGHKFTDKEKEDLSMGKKNKDYGGSWHINVGLYEVNGIKMISTELGGLVCYILKRDEIEKLLDMTKSYNYYRHEDKDEQLLRVGGRFLEYGEIDDIFADLLDLDNKITMVDFNQIAKDQIMIKFMTTNASFDKELVDTLKDNISRFTNVYGFEFDRIDLTLNKFMYTSGSNDAWLYKDRPVNKYKDLDKLMEIGEMEYGLHTISHAMYIIFNVK